MEVKKTASEKYNQFIDFNGMARTIRDGHEVAYRLDDDNDTIILAWEKDGEYYSRTISVKDLQSTEAFESMMCYNAQHLSECDEHTVGYWCDIMRSNGDLYEGAYLAEIVSWDCFSGDKFEDDKEITFNSVAECLEYLASEDYLTGGDSIEFHGARGDANRVYEVCTYGECHNLLSSYKINL